MKNLPLIDISDSVRSVQEIERACREIGFMNIVGHGIANETITNIRNAVVAYFDLPLATKIDDQIRPENYRGYIPVGFFSANSADAGNDNYDNYEGYKLHFELAADDPLRSECDLYGPNKWPLVPPDFRQHILNYWAECDRVANVLLGALAEILGTPKQQFLQFFEMPLTNMTLLHYPPQDAAATGFGIHPHKDTDALTILAPDPVGGLLVKCRGDDTWIEANPPDGALIVNLGDLLELWSGGYFVSTPHKVVNTSGAERFSFPYFAVPRFDTLVEPLREPLPGFSRCSVHVGDVSREVWRTNWPGEKASNSKYDLGTLED
jgi:isopenicillin N synthase-like dioxygenase